MDKKQKLAIITTWYPPVNGIFVENFARDFSSEYDVHVFVCFHSLRSYTNTTIEKGVNVHRIYFPHIPRRTKFLMNWWIKTFTSRVLKIDNQFDIIHAHNYFGGLVAEKVSDKTNTNYVVTLHSTEIIMRELSSLKMGLLKSSLPKAKAVITVGHRLQKIVDTDFNIKSNLIPNYVDTTIFLEKEEIHNSFRYVIVGGLEERKGVRRVIDVFEKLGLDNTELHVVGTSKNDLSLDNESVILHGRMRNKDLPSVIRKCHVLISFSSFETFGISLIEAMAAGLSVIYTKSGGPEYFVPEFAGLCIERENEDLSQAMVAMKNNYSDYSANQIRSYVIENFDKIHIKQRIVNIYNS